MAISVTDSEFVDQPSVDEISLSSHEIGARALFNYYTRFPESHSYDIVQFEEEYYFTPKNTDYSRDEYTQSQEVLWSRPKGEFDILLLNVDDQQAFYVEIKGSKNDKEDGKGQIDRADRTFTQLKEDHSDFDWDLSGVTVATDELVLPRICYEDLEDDFESEEFLEEDKKQDPSYSRLRSMLTDQNHIRNNKHRKLD